MLETAPPEPASQFPTFAKKLQPQPARFQHRLRNWDFLAGTSAVCASSALAPRRRRSHQRPTSCCATPRRRPTAVRRPRIRSVYVVSQCDTGPHEICRGLWEVFKGFVGQLMMLAEGWDTVIPVPEAHRPNRTFNPTPTAADSCCGHTAVSGVQ